MASYTRDQKLTEGKTKIVWSVAGDRELVILESKDDITAGDGVKHDLIGGKAQMANQTTCNVFRLLKTHREIPLAFLEQLDDTSFLAYRAQMLPWEVVCRRKAWGSYLKRFPHQKGFEFNPPLVEFFLKTTGKQWNGHSLVEDDPFAIILADEIRLYNPKLPYVGNEPFLIVHDVPGWNRWQDMGPITEDVFTIVEEAWVKLGGRLIDFKIEFGLLSDGELVVADVIDNDSWRVLDENDQHIDKQAYRDGESLDNVTAKYRYVAQLTSQF